VFSPPSRIFSRAKNVKRYAMYKVYLYNFQTYLSGEYFSLERAKKAGYDTGFDFVIYQHGEVVYSGGPFGARYMGS